MTDGPQKSGARGRDFELVVQALLVTLASRHPDAVRVEYQPELVLDSERVVIPDFDLHVDLIFEEARYLIECQDRDQYDSAIADKISRIKTQSDRNRFIFLSGAAIPRALKKALDRDGVLNMPIEQFVVFVTRLDEVLSAIRSANPRLSETAPNELMRAVEAWLDGNSTRHPFHALTQKYRDFDPDDDSPVSGAHLASPRESLPFDEWVRVTLSDGGRVEQLHKRYIRRLDKNGALRGEWEPFRPGYDFWYCLLHARRNPKPHRRYRSAI